MDSRLNSVVTLLTLILLSSLFTSLIPVSEARPLPSPLPDKYSIIRKVNGVFRTLKGAGPSPGVGHRLKKLQNHEGIKDSDPTPVKMFQSLGGMKDSGPSPGIGHRLKTLQVHGVIKHSGPSPGQGHKLITNNQ